MGTSIVITAVASLYFNSVNKKTEAKICLFLGIVGCLMVVLSSFITGGVPK